MLYNLRIDKTRYTGKTLQECAAILAAKKDQIDGRARMPAAGILADVATLKSNLRRSVYFGHDGKVFISINRKKVEN